MSPTKMCASSGAPIGTGESTKICALFKNNYEIYYNKGNEENPQKSVSKCK